MSAARTWVMAATICSGSASLKVSRICSTCSSVTGSSSKNSSRACSTCSSVSSSGTVVGDEFSTSNSVVSGIYSCGSCGSVGCSVSSGAGSTS
jgi:hypothetical protein